MFTDSMPVKVVTGGVELSLSQESPSPSLSKSSWPELGIPTQLSCAHLGSEQLRAASGQPSLSASRPQRDPGPAQPGRHWHTSQGRLSEELQELLEALTITALMSQLNWGQDVVGGVVIGSVEIDTVVVVVVEVVVGVVAGHVSSGVCSG